MLNKTYIMDCRDGIKLLDDNSVNLVVTSPPYAKQREAYYTSVDENDYPAWTVSWMRLLKPKMAKEGSICINIRPHIKNGQVSDYVAKTVAAIRADGWIECEEVIWYKPDSPPMGSVLRPRRAWESIYWFSLTNNPKCDTKANGNASDRIGLEQCKYIESNNGYVHKGQKRARKGVARHNDVIVCGTSHIEKGYSHPAMFPIEIPEYFIKMLTTENDMVVDVFAGSGTTGRAAKKLNRNYIGFEIKKEYVMESEAGNEIKDNRK